MYSKALEYMGPKRVFLTRVESSLVPIQTSVYFPNWNSKNEFTEISLQDKVKEMGQGFPIGLQKETDYQFEFHIYKFNC